ncbi:MAG: fliF [Clostridiales bacterium]|nr:fliF [Clostridiales bacterium]
MPDFLTNIQQKSTELWKNFDKSQKTRLGIISAVLVVALSLTIYYISKPNFVPLISSEDSKEIGEMVKILEDKKIRFKPDGNKSILVNSRDNDKAQAAIIQAGYPKTSSLTFDDALSKIKINTTESDKRKIWEKEQEASLRTKLKLLDNIKDASVDLSLPEPSFLAISGKEQPKPGAAIYVTPKTELTQQQVQGIVALVSRGVENLNTKDISVVNTVTGNELTNQESDLSKNPGTQYEMQLQKKKELEKNVREMFSGQQFDQFDSVRVVANPILNFDKITSNSSLIEKPNGFDAGVPVSEQINSEKLVNPGQGGVPGLESNPGNTTTPTYQVGTGNNSTYDKKGSTTNYDYNRSNVVEEKAIGKMNPQESSMAVTLLYGVKATDESKLTTEFLDSFKQDVSMATGIPATRISVNRYKITPPIQEKPKQSEIIKQMVDTYGLLALLLILTAVLVIAVLPRRKRKGDDLQEELQPAGPRFVMPDIENVPEIELEERSEVKKQLDKFVKQKPEAVAQLLRNWLSDDWE